MRPCAMRLMSGAVMALVLALAWGATACVSQPPTPPDSDYVLEHLRQEHPRLFLNQDIIDNIKEKGLTPSQQEWQAELLKRVNNYPTPPETNEQLVAKMRSQDGGVTYNPKNPPRVKDGSWGFYSAHSALAYILTDEKKYYDKTVEYLRHTAAVYGVIHDNGRIPVNRSFVRLAALSAYDWIYNDLPPEERQSIGNGLFHPLLAFHRHWRKARPGTVDLYTDKLMGWYLGLVYLHSDIEGVDDRLCEDLLRRQYQHHLYVFDNLTRGPDGLDLYGAIGYSTQNPQAEVNFYDSWRSAIGGNFARYYPKRIHLNEYFLWNTIDPQQDRGYSYGWSDVFHNSNRMDRYHQHYLYRAVDLYEGVVAQQTLDLLGAIAQFKCPVNFDECLRTDGYYQTPAAPLLMTRKAYSQAEIMAALDRLPHARQFPDPVGQTFMNSGWGPDDTYCLFIGGRQTSERKHYDENHFTIFKRGFLALDSGTRAYGGSRNEIGWKHHISYYFNTVAHNCILIRMEGETLPGFWGYDSEANTGGMNKNHGAQIKGYETNDHFTYIASDATSCYHEDKAAQVVRQFLFVYPDYFVVFDRVTSKKPDQPKRWLLHTQNEPTVEGDTFMADHWNGRIAARTLLPQDFKSEKIGGPGKEYWADGRNWPMPGRDTPRFENNLYGQWRMEVSPGEGRLKDRFLHFIQVGIADQFDQMAPSELVEEGQQSGIEFRVPGKLVRVLFNRDGEVGGNIRIEDADGRVLVDRSFTQDVMTQHDLFSPVAHPAE